MNLKLCFSTCPNDTFMFEALVKGRIPHDGIHYDVEMNDIFHLNQMAMKGEADVIKISYNTYGLVMGEYELLDAGSALGHGCGPLLITKHPQTIEQLIENNSKIAIPGLSTTANLLLTFFAPKIRNKKEMLFQDIMPAIASGEVDAGVIIHENRFTYSEFGLQLIQDLGEHWERVTGLPIPLGAIVAKRSLGQEVIRSIERQIRESVLFAFHHPMTVQPFVAQYAQELSPAVQAAHIQLYVNQYSVSLGEKGREAVELLLKVARNLGYYK